MNKVTTAPRVFMWDGGEPPADVQAVRWLDWQIDGQGVFLLRGTVGWVWCPDILAKPWQSGKAWEDAVADRPGRYEECLWLPHLLERGAA